MDYYRGKCCLCGVIVNGMYILSQRASYYMIQPLGILENVSLQSLQSLCGERGQVAVLAGQWVYSAAVGDMIQFSQPFVQCAADSEPSTKQGLQFLKCVGYGSSSLRHATQIPDVTKGVRERRGSV